MASFVIVVVFLPTSTVASSEAPADYRARARSNRRHSGEASKTMDYKSVYTNLCLELQQNRSWIKGLKTRLSCHSTEHALSWSVLNTGVYTRHPTFVTATSGVLTRLPAWLSKNRMRVYTLSNGKIACIHGLRSEGVKDTTAVTQRAYLLVCFNPCYAHHSLLFMHPHFMIYT